MRNYFYIGVFLGSIVAAPVCAQEQGDEALPDLVIAEKARDTYITVLASGDDRTIAQTGQPIAIIGADEIERVQGADVTRLVERLPGVTLSRNGGLGAFTGMRVRGAGSEQLLVIIDGVRVADVAAPGGGFDFGTLLPAAIGKIELLRGSNSTIWGSDAIGGVLAASSDGLYGEQISAEYGGPSSVYFRASTRHPYGPISFALNAAYLDMGGISAAVGGAEPDGLKHWQVGGELSVSLTEGLNLRGSLRHDDARLEIDGFPAPDYVLADTQEYQDTRRSSGSVGLDYFGEEVELKARLALSETERELFDPAFGAAPAYTTKGRDLRAELRGSWYPADDFDLRFGAERSWSRFSTLFDQEREAASTGVYAQLGFTGDWIVANAGIRYDDHQGFGGEFVFGADARADLWEGWFLRASYGDAFKAPSLFQLHSDYGNSLLMPERSRGYDFGIGTGDRDDGFHVEISFYRRDSRDLIDFISCFGESEGICENRPFGTYDNVGRARAQGIEVEAAWQPIYALRLQGAYSYVEAVNRTPASANEGLDLARRPRHALSLSADWETPLAGLKLGADLRVVSSSFDDAGNFVRLDPYAVGTLRASIPLGSHVELYGRIENIWDEQYQTAAGYGTPGRSAYFGARATW